MRHRPVADANMYVSLPTQLCLTGTAPDEDDDMAAVNPYADPNYPDLEFINYSDPAYSINQGDDYLEQSPEDSTEAQMEAMREDQRRRNDEFQFQTYYQRVLRNGESEFCGEWTVYKTSTFLDNIPDEGPVPRLVKAGNQPLMVVSRGYKTRVETDSEYMVDCERIVHVEEIRQPTLMGDKDLAEFAKDNQPMSEEKDATENEIMGNTYWPEALKAYDFRGHQGTMVCGK